MDSIGREWEHKLIQCEGMGDIYDEANGGANPKAHIEIAGQLAILQAMENAKKGLQLSEDRSRYIKKDNGRGGGGAGSGGSSGTKRGNSGDKDSGERSSKRQRTNGGGPKDEGGFKDYSNSKCQLPNHGNHKWKDCRCNYRNKANYNHEMAVRVSQKDGAPDWFKKQVERSIKIKANQGGNGGDQSYYQQQHQYQQPPPQEQAYMHQPPPQQPPQHPPPQHGTYMQIPPQGPPPPGAIPPGPRGPGRDGPPSAPASGKRGGWYYREF